jgi:hemolysin D
MLTGKIARISADATESTTQNTGNNASDAGAPTTIATYKARVKLDQQVLSDPQGAALAITPGMQVVAEINQGKRTVLEYLLSPVQKAVQESGRER